MTTYEERKQAKIDRLHQAAQTAKQESEQAFNRAHSMADVIPFGQPILVGHYSEGPDRRYRSRIDNQYKKGIELSDKAARLEARAHAAEQNRAIFSDDPNADEKLEAKIERLTKQQEYMKAANKLFRKADKEGLLDMGFTSTQIEKLLIPDFCGRIGFPDYLITNNSANIRRLKERLITIKARVEQEYKETTTETGIKIEENPEENRLRIYFPDKPDKSIRLFLQSHGFRWAPSMGCWSGYLNNNSRYYANQLISQEVK